ncbi:flavin reductase family protein [Kitasatospora sp. NBC_00315]|uniref:flavin reductase family protein n=1 Tax=Kitasatospora sp. NBC_00315 TaxID=2975963 RepID=UPI0032536EBD
MTVALEDFMRAMSRVPGPVVVATTVDDAGRSWGFTASSFSSLSLSPPLVLVCLDSSASTHEAFVGAAGFMVNVLADDQADVARRFAGPGADRFRAGDTTALELGLPGVPTATARLACSMYRVLGAGDHSILIGQVEAAYVGGHTPLMYVDRSFARPAALDASVRLAPAY